MNRISETCLDHMKQYILHLVEFPGEKRETGTKYTRAQNKQRVKTM